MGTQFRAGGLVVLATLGYTGLQHKR